MKKSIKMIVNGTVQGVFFRQFVKENADKMNVFGFVRNLISGDVEIVAEGDGTALESFVRVIQKGPQHAMIKNVQVEEKKWTGEYKDFRVLRF